MYSTQILPGQHVSIDLKLTVDTATSTSPGYSYAIHLPLTLAGVIPISASITSTPAGTSASDFDITVIPAGPNEGIRCRYTGTAALASAEALRVSFVVGVSGSAAALATFRLSPAAEVCAQPGCAAPTSFEATVPPVTIVVAAPYAVATTRGGCAPCCAVPVLCCAVPVL